MAKNILILSASLRAGSNSEALANAFADGARGRERRPLRPR